MRRHRWVYLLIVALGAVLAFGIAGVPSTHHDAPLHVVATTTTTVPSTPSGTG